MRRNLSACRIFIHTEHYMCDNPTFKYQYQRSIHYYYYYYYYHQLCKQTQLSMSVTPLILQQLLPPITVYLLASHSFLLGHIGLDSPYIVRPSICSIFHFQSHRFMAFDLRRIIELQNIQLCIHAINIICSSLKSRYIKMDAKVSSVCMYVCMYVLIG